MYNRVPGAPNKIIESSLTAATELKSCRRNVAITQPLQPKLCFPPPDAIMALRPCSLVTMISSILRQSCHATCMTICNVSLCCPMSRVASSPDLEAHTHTYTFLYSWGVSSIVSPLCVRNTDTFSSFKRSHTICRYTSMLLISTIFESLLALRTLLDRLSPRFCMLFRIHIPNPRSQSSLQWLIFSSCTQIDTRFVRGEDSAKSVIKILEGCTKFAFCVPQHCIQLG